MYPFLEHGMTTLGGESKAPKHLESFCGSFINLCFAVSSQFAGAVATVEWLMYFDHFARKDYGEDYLNTHKDSIIAKFQHTVYSLNQALSFKKAYRNVIVLPKLTFPDEKLLRLEIAERQISGRVIYIPIEYEDILHADSFDKSIIKRLPFHIYDKH